jgi:large subunit ribosomal protein L19
MSNQKIAKSSVVQAQLRTDIPEFQVGSLISVHYKIIEKTTKGLAKERVQIFKGIVIDRHRKNSLDATYTVLKVGASNIKVKRVFPVHSPMVDKVTVEKLQRGRRANLRYLIDVKSPEKSLRARSVKPKTVVEA